jgi:hypothetical protein
VRGPATPSTTFLDAFVAGNPSSFATAGERPWKDAIASQLGSIQVGSAARRIELDFVVSPRAGYVEGADLDNLCEPVFSAVVNRLGWFGGRRSNIAAHHARKRIGTPTGCQVRILEELGESSWTDGTMIFDATSSLGLPRSARDVEFASWIRQLMPRPADEGRFGVDLRFRDRLNIADIATGRVKNVIDCLFPIIGGQAGSPADWRVIALEVRHTDADVQGTIRVRVTELS